MDAKLSVQVKELALNAKTKDIKYDSVNGQIDEITFLKISDDNKYYIDTTESTKKKATKKEIVPDADIDTVVKKTKKIKKTKVSDE